MNRTSPPRRRLLVGVVATAAASLVLAACGGSDDESSSPGSGSESLTKIKLNLSWVDQAEYAGFYIADKKGYYEDEGIDIEITPGGPDVKPLQVLAAGQVDIAMDSYGGVLAAREGGADIEAVAPVFERSANLLVYKCDQPDLANPANWKGKKVALWGGWNATFAATLGKYGLTPDDMEVSNEGFDMTGFVKEGQDLADAMIYNEYAQAIAGGGGQKICYFDYNKEGTAMLEQMLAVDKGWAADHADLLTGFLKASMKGWLDARDDPKLGVDTTLEIGTALPENFQTWQMNEINKLIWPSTAGLFTVPDAQWTQNEDELVKYGVVKSAVTHSDAVDMSYRDAAAKELTDEGADLTGASYVPDEIDPYTFFK